MPVRLGNGSIELIHPDKTYVVETIKSTGERDGDTVVNEPTIGELNESYVNQPRPITEYTVLDCDSTNLIAWYKFDLGEELTDSKGNYPLTNDGSVTFSSDTKMIGKSSYFPNSDYDGYLNITGVFNPYNIWVGNGISFSIWYNLNYSGTDRFGRIFEFGSSNTSRFSITTKDNGTNVIALQLYNSSYLGNVPVGSGSLDDRWHHLVWSIDTSGVWTCYIDGINENINITASIPNMSFTLNRLGKSIYHNTDQQDLKGYLDDFRIYNKVLTPLEIDALANQKIRNYVEPQTLTHYTAERMYPPTRNLTSASHTISGEAYGNGLYETWESSVYSGYGVTHYAYTAFNTSDGTGYHAYPNRYNGSSYNHTDYIVSDYLGDWLKIKLPVKINLSKYGFKQRDNVSYPDRAPAQYKIYGSNDNINWDVLVHKTSNITYSGVYFYENITTTGEYQYFAFVCNILSGSGNMLNFDEWFIYGKEYLYEDPNYKTLTFTYDATRYPKIDADDTNLIAWYKFDGNFDDSSGNEYDLVVGGGTPTFSSTDFVIGQSANFLDGNNWVRTLTGASTPYSFDGGNWSMAMWVKINASSTANDYVIWCTPNTNYVYGGLVYAYSSRFWDFSLFRNGAYESPEIYNHVFTGNFPQDVGNWVHIVVQQRTDGRIEIWRNGNLEATGTDTTITNNLFNQTSLDFGYFARGTRDAFALMDDFRWYDKALTEAEIQELYNVNQTPYTLTFDNPTEGDILVGGGGGGGSRWRAGGGGGDVLYFQGVDLSGTYNIKVGEGGAVPRDTSQVHKWGGYNGEISSITGGDSGKTLNINASGGAGAGGWSLDPLNPVTVLYTNPITGATETSSGGGAGTANTNHIPSTGNGVSGNGAQGDYDGWENSADDGAGGGGGGGGTNGNGGLPVGETGGTGGDGENINITGTSIMYGRGGDGWGENNGTPIITPENIGQGGAGARNPGGIHRPGGSGIVIIRYKTQYNQVPFNAQWTYSATDTSVHHYGNVGIGTTASDNTALTIKGDMNMIGNYYKNNVLLTEKWLSSSANTNNIYREKGFVGIGTYDVQYGIHVEGQIYASSGGITGDGSTTWSAPSDSRIKQNIVPASGKKCVENIRNINLYRFNYDSSFIDTDDRNQLGFIAQEVQQYYPKAVKRNSVVLKNNNKIDGLLSVDVTQINYTLYGAVKKLTEDIIAIKENLGITEIQKDVKNVAYVREDGEDSNGLIMS